MVFASLGAAESMVGGSLIFICSLALRLPVMTMSVISTGLAADPDDLDYQLALYPNPAPLLGLSGKSTLYPQIDEGEVRRAPRQLWWKS